jgi:hypothetical protein
MRSGLSSGPVRAGWSEMVLASWALIGKRFGAEPGEGHWLRRLGRRLGFGKASEGGIRWSGTSWSSARGQPVDHLRVVAACLLTGQHRGNGLGSPRRHWYREDPLGVPTAHRARRGRRGRAHSHPLLETAAVVAAILIGGHSTLQGCSVGGVGTGSLFYAQAFLSSRANRQGPPRSRPRRGVSRAKRTLARPLHSPEGA